MKIRKLLAVILASVLAFSMCSCGKIKKFPIKKVEIEVIGKKTIVVSGKGFENEKLILQELVYGSGL